jgi:hypothetical protein
MKKISLLTVALIAVLALCVGTASAQTASIGYQGMAGTGTNILSGLSVRGWVDVIGWEGTLFFGREDTEYKNTNGSYNSEADTDIWALDLQVMYAIIAKENSKLYLGLDFGIGRMNTESSYNYPLNTPPSSGSDETDTDFWFAGPLVGAQYSLQGIPELSFNWEVGYTFMNASEENADNGAAYSETDTNLDGMNTTIGVHYAF